MCQCVVKWNMHRCFFIKYQVHSISIFIFIFFNNESNLVDLIFKLFPAFPMESFLTVNDGLILTDAIVIYCRTLWHHVMHYTSFIHAFQCNAWLLSNRKTDRLNHAT